MKPRREPTSGFTFSPLRFDYETAVRAIFDVAMINLAMVLGLGTSVLFAFGEVPSRGASTIFREHLHAQLVWSWLLASIAFGVFSASGFYSKGRAYRGRFRPLVVGQAVALVFILYGFISYMAPGVFGIARSSLVISAIYATVFIVGSRTWSRLWRRIAFSRPRSVPDGSHPLKCILVIGGAGYVGSALLKHLLERGYQVRLLDIFMYGEEPIVDLLDHPRLEVIRADFRQVDKVVGALYGMDAVIHIGAIVGDPACALDEAFTIDVNLTATRMIAEVAKARGIRRFIFASTCSVYGASDQLLDETSDLNPVSLYARSKIASEEALQALANGVFLPSILRFGTVYGLSGRTRFDLVLNLLTAKAVVDGKITVFGEDQWRPFVHVEDTALAIVKVLEAPIELVGNEVFNVGSDDQNRTLGEIGEAINARVPTAELLISAADGDRRNYRVDFSKIRDRLGFAATWTIDEGIVQVIEAFQTGSVVNYTDARYSNVKFLTEESGRNFIDIPTRPKAEQAWLK